METPAVSGVVDAPSQPTYRNLVLVYKARHLRLNRLRKAVTQEATARAQRSIASSDRRIDVTKNPVSMCELQSITGKLLSIFVLGAPCATKGDKVQFCSLANTFRLKAAEHQVPAVR